MPLAARKHGDADPLGAAGHGDAVGRVTARHIGERRELGHRRDGAAARAEGLAEFERAAGVTGIEHDRSVDRPARLGKPAGDGSMGEGRQHDEGRIRIGDRRPEIMGDRPRPRQARAEHAFIADAARSLERGKRLGRPVPEDDVMPGSDELDHGRGPAGAGPEHGDLHGRLGEPGGGRAGTRVAGRNDMATDLSRGVITP
jgi:hypothetical protein